MSCKTYLKSNNTLKKAAAIASLSVAVTLIVLKIFGAIYTGSLSVLSSLIDSLTDLFASLVTFVSIKISILPPSCSHRYGYGKVESLSALFQSAFIAGSGFFILYDGINRIFNPVEIQQTTMGIIIMALSLFITFALVLFQNYVTKKTQSAAISADSAHYVVDLATNLVTILSLVVVKYFDFLWFDILAACLISLYLLINAYKIGKDAIFVLMDKELDKCVREKIIETAKNTDGVLGVHDLRTHDLGGVYLFEMHLEMNGNLALNKTHEISQAVEDKILQIYPDAQIIIHQDPFGVEESRLDNQLPDDCSIV